MDFFKWAIMAMVSSKFLVVLVYIYLYILYRNRYMGIWALGWLIQILRLAFFDFTSLAHSSVPFLLTFQLLSISIGMLLVWGTFDFMEQPCKKWWLFTAFSVTVVSDIAIILNLPVIMQALPTAWLIGILLIRTGIMFMRRVRVYGIGKFITGGAFILLGIHDLAFPFLVLFSPLVPWAVLFGTALQVIIALGTLLVYFEKIRLDLTSKERYYRLITENALDIIYRFQYRPKPAFEYVSPALTGITGYTPAEFYTDPELELKITHPEDRQALANFRNTPSLTDKPVIFRMIRKDGTLIWTEQRGVPIYDHTGALLAFEGIIRDITDRKLLEQDMARLEGLNAIGQMAANIAHEIRNPMTIVRGYLQLLGNKQEFGAYKEEFDLLLSELDRTNSIITEYLALSKEKLANFTMGQMNDIVQFMLPLIQADANAHDKMIKTELAATSDIRLDEKEIRQLILNLVRNGLEAMDAGGVLTIETRQEQGSVVLAISDQGKGIPEEVLNRIGTPFLTTKENGTGLGLPVCFSIANRHHATIELETSSSGTTFYVRFPLPDEKDKNN